MNRTFVMTQLLAFNDWYNYMFSFTYSVTYFWKGKIYINFQTCFARF